MKCLSLRWRIILALIALTLGTTLALSLLAWHYLDLSLESSINEQTGEALKDALVIAKENYDMRKALMGEAGRRLARTGLPLEAFRSQSADRVRDYLAAQGLKRCEVRLLGPEAFAAEIPNPGREPQVFRSPERQNLLQLAVPVVENGRPVGAVLVSQRLDELLNVEQATQVYEHLQMIETDLRWGFLLAFLVAAAGLLLLACLVGIRVGFGVTTPLYGLIKGTRELARDNLDYRIPPGRDDEIGLVIDSFNRMAEDLKQNRQQRLEVEKIAAWREIARRLAHEIKNPLTPIQLTVQQMRDKYTGADPAYRKLVEDCTEIVTEEVESLRALVQEFADFARMPSLSLGRQNLNAVLADAVRLYPDADVRLDLQPDLPELDLDGEQMRRVLINLIENGLEASGGRGRITLRTRLRDAFVSLLVSDNGPGVPETDRERIFQPYVSSKQSGMGLGLAMVRSIVENHGGQVTVSSAPEGGAQFEITLPVPEGAARRPEVHT